MDQKHSKKHLLEFYCIKKLWGCIGVQARLTMSDFRKSQKEFFVDLENSNECYAFLNPTVLDSCRAG